MSPNIKSQPIKRALIVSFLTVLSLSAAPSISLGARACGEIVKAKEKTSGEYLETARWLWELIRQSNMVAGESYIGAIDFPRPESTRASQAIEKQLGSFSKSEWSPKSNIKDPDVVEQILEEIKEITKNQIIELKTNSSSANQEIITMQTEKAIIEVFENYFGPFAKDSELGQRISAAKSFSAEVELPKLTAHQEQLLRKHKIAKWAQKLGDGSDLAFSSMHFKVTDESKLYKGERAQAIFLQKVLGSLFPKAIFVDKGDDPIPNRKRIKITIADLGEALSGHLNRIDELEKKGAVLPMNLSKAANLREGRKEKQQARRDLNLPPNRKIVHMYVRSYDTMTSPSGKSQFPELLSAMDKFSPLDIVIITFGNEGKNMGFNDSKIVESFQWNQKTFLNGVKDVPNRTLIVNNTFGKMMDIHAASDYSVIVGPVNFFESINVGTPTLVIAKTYAEDKKSDYGQYDRDYYQRSLETGEKSGLLRWTQIRRINPSYAEVPKLLEELSMAKVSSSPIVDKTFPIYLDAVLNHLDYGMNRFDKKDFSGLGGG